MRILVLGGDGMLGHELFTNLRTRHETRVTLRQSLAAYSARGLFTASNAFAGVDVRTPGHLEQVLREFKPDAVVNAVGIVPQRPESKQAVVSIEVNALVPHRVAIACRGTARLIHLS